MSAEMTPETASNETLFAKLTDLVKNKKNKEIQCIVKDTTSSDLLDQSGLTLLHLAAKYNNTELIGFLLNCGHDIEGKTTSGLTPLLMSAMHASYDAAKHLLDANADVLATDSDDLCPLRLLLEAWKDLPDEVSASLRGRLERSLAGKEARFAKQALEEDLFYRKLDCDGFVELAVDMGLVESIEIVMHYSNESRERKIALVKKLAAIMTAPHPKLETAKAIVEKLAEWRVDDKVSMEPMNAIFRGGSEEAVTTLINCGIDPYGNSAACRDFLSLVFQNPNVDVLKLLKSNRWDVNRKNHEECTLLHYAVRFKTTSFVRRLLDLGADPNARRWDGRTPMFSAVHPDCLELLLLRGGKYSIADHRYNTILHVFKRKRSLLNVAVVFMTDRLFSRVAVADGERRVLGDYEITDMIRETRCQLEWMELKLVCEETSLYDLFKATNEELISYDFDRREVEVVSRTLKHMRDNKFNPYLISRIERQAKRAFEFYPMKLEIAMALAECLGVADWDHLVVEKIVGYLTIQDVFECL